MEGLKSINIGIRFLLELLAIYIYGYWGFHVTGHLFLRFVLGIGAPILAAAFWGIFVAPKAVYRLNGISRLLLEIIILGLPTAALFMLQQNTIAFCYGVIMIVNLILVYVWKQ